MGMRKIEQAMKKAFAVQGKDSVVIPRRHVTKGGMTCDHIPFNQESPRETVVMVKNGPKHQQLYKMHTGEYGKPIEVFVNGSNLKPNPAWLAYQAGQQGAVR